MNLREGEGRVLMKKDILLVDDEEKWVRLMSRKVKKTRFNPIEFTDFYRALDYVIEKAGDLYACFVDMKPILKDPTTMQITDEERNLLETPEKMYNEARSRGASDRFYFISAHKSEYDEGVLERTGAGFIQKIDLRKKISEILGE